MIRPTFAEACRPFGYRIEPREPLFLFSSRYEGQDLLRACSWCKRVDVGEGNWCEIEEAIEKLGLFRESSPPKISHTMCFDCLAKLYGDEADR